MPVFRVDKSRDFTVVANCIFKDRSLSAKAKGILVEMLSLPDSWDFTLKGLTTLFTDGIDSIRQGINELESRGYIVRERKRDARGRLGGMEYVIYETPHKPVENSPESAEPTTENPTQEFSTEERPTTYKELSKSITNASITKESSTDSFLPEVSKSFEDYEPVERSGRKEVSDTSRAREEIKRQIEYDILVQRCQPSQLDELVEIMLEVKMNLSPTTRFSRDEVYPTVYVQDRYSKLTSEHIEQVLDGIRGNTSKVMHTKAYLMKCLFNAPETLENKVMMDVNHDLFGERRRE
jgi:hypothetical protein